jgi:hypothetical protein
MEGADRDTLESDAHWEGLSQRGEALATALKEAKEFEKGHRDLLKKAIEAAYDSSPAEHDWGTIMAIAIKEVD